MIRMVMERRVRERKGGVREEMGGIGDLLVNPQEPRNVRGQISEHAT